MHLILVFLFTLFISLTPAIAACPPAPIANADDMVLRFPVAQGIWAGSASSMPDNVTNTAANVEGVVVYDAAEKTLKLCNGDSWQALTGTTGITNAAGNQGSVQFNDGADNLGADDEFTWDNTHKRLGIGHIETVLAPLHISAISDGTGTVILDGYGSTASQGTSINARRARGTPLAPEALRAGDWLFLFGARGYTPTGFTDNTKARIIFGTTENWTDTAQGTYLRFDTTSAGTTDTLERMRITDSGFVGIGTTAPQHPLEVSGATKADMYIMRPRSPVMNLAEMYAAAMLPSATDSSAIGLVNATSDGLQNQETVIMLADGQLNNDDALSVLTYNQNGLSHVNLRVLANGKVGVGNKTPLSRLVVGDGTANDINDYEVIEIQSKGYAGLHVIGDYENISGEPGGSFVKLTLDGNNGLDTNWGAVFSAVNRAESDGVGNVYTGAINNAILLGTYGSMQLQFGTNTAVRATIQTNGNFGIGVTNPSHLLHVAGIARSTQANFVTSSDMRVKENISSITGGLEVITALNPVNFEYTKEYRADNNALSGQKRGFIAQEVEAILPDMVMQVEEPVGTSRFTDFRVLNSSDFVPFLVSAVKQLKAENDDLRHDLEALREQVEALQSSH